MKKNEVINTIKNTRLDNDVYVTINNKDYHIWTYQVTRLINEELDNDTNYTVNFKDVYNTKFYRYYGTIVINTEK